MTNSERYQKYVKEHCSNCNNKDSDLCEIRIFTVNKTTTTQCIYYDSNYIPKKKEKELKRTARQIKSLMGFTQNY